MHCFKSKFVEPSYKNKPPILLLYCAKRGSWTWITSRNPVMLFYYLLWIGKQNHNAMQKSANLSIWPLFQNLFSFRMMLDSGLHAVAVEVLQPLQRPFFASKKPLFYIFPIEGDFNSQILTHTWWTDEVKPPVYQASCQSLQRRHVCLNTCYGHLLWQMMRRMVFTTHQCLNWPNSTQQCVV